MRVYPVRLVRLSSWRGSTEIRHWAYRGAERALCGKLGRDPGLTERPTRAEACAACKGRVARDDL